MSAGAAASARPQGGALLETRALCRNFGALQVSNNEDSRLEAGARHALIGPTGAGKTTFINLLTGVLAPSSGQVLLDGEDLRGGGRPEFAQGGGVAPGDVEGLRRKAGEVLRGMLGEDGGA